MSFCINKTARLWIAATACLVVATARAQEPTEAKAPAADNPAVAAILATKPTTPSECVRAAKTLVDLRQPEAARQFVQKLLDAKLNEQQLADLGREFGTPLFIDLVHQETLLPEARQLADAVIAAVKARVENAEFIAKAIAQLQGDSEDARLQAMIDLQQAGAAAVTPLLGVLADPARTAEYANVRTVLSSMGQAARDPLVAILESGDAKRTVQAIETLAEMKNPKAAIFLIAPCYSAKNADEVRAAAALALHRLGENVPDQAAAVRILREAAQRYVDRKQPIEGVLDNRVDLWQWDVAKQQPVLRQGTPEDAWRAIAARLARDAYGLAADDPAIRRLYLLTAFEQAAYAAGLDQPLDASTAALADAKAFGAKTVDDVLDEALEARRFVAATVAARLLGQIGNADELLYQGDKPAPLVRAVQQPDRRLRIAALTAIVRLKPTKPFAGSSYVPGALGFLAGSTGGRQVLVVGPNSQQTSELTGLLAAAGMQSESATNGHDALKLLVRSADFEAVFIDVSISRPDPGTLLQELRRDSRTALLPVAFVAREGFTNRADELARQDALSRAFARPHDVDAVRWQLAQLAAVAPDAVAVPVRQQQAAESLDLLLELSGGSNKLYDLQNVRDAVLSVLYHPGLSEKAIAVLASNNSPEGQRALVDLASRLTQSLELRKAAAKAFRESVQKHGILLTTAEIRKQYDRYNESEKQDAETQRVLALILDCLEAPTKPLAPTP